MAKGKANRSKGRIASSAGAAEFLFRLGQEHVAVSPAFSAAGAFKAVSASHTTSETLVGT